MLSLLDNEEIRVVMLEIKVEELDEESLITVLAILLEILEIAAESLYLDCNFAILSNICIFTVFTSEDVLIPLLKRNKSCKKLLY